MRNNMKRQEQNVKAFKKAVEATVDIASGYRSGLQALGSYSEKIQTLDKNKIVGGSVDIDATTQKLYPVDPRWDYAFDYGGEVFYVEIHPAFARDIQKIKEKLTWLKNWLETKAPAMQKMTADYCPYCWVYTGHYGIPSTASYNRQLAQLGMRPKRVWTYPKP